MVYLDMLGIILNINEPKYTKTMTEFIKAIQNW